MRRDICLNRIDSCLLWVFPESLLCAPQVNYDRLEGAFEKESSICIMQKILNVNPLRSVLKTKTNIFLVLSGADDQLLTSLR